MSNDRNEAMSRRFKDHLCLHCKYISYWDWYYCSKRKFTLKDFGIVEFFRWIKQYAVDGWSYYQEKWPIDSGIIRWIKDKQQWIPNKPIRKCKYYEHSDRKKFWL